MKSFRNVFSMLGVALILMSMITACTDYNVAPEDGFKIWLTDNGTFGKMLINQNNQSMYFFSKDVAGEATCTDGCADKWPAVKGDVADMELGAGLDKSDFGSISLGYGEYQITYKGWPLYYYSPTGDGELEQPWETKGDGVGEVWYVAKPDYSMMVASQEVDGAELTYLVNDKGVSLYYNTGDETNTSKCTGGCADVWTPFKKGEMTLPSSLKAADFDEAYRDDNLGPQLSYQGNPLYYFSQDEGKQGSTKGQAGGPAKSFFLMGKK